MQDLIGTQIGRLTVIEIVNPEETRVSKTILKCKCKCGNIVYHKKNRLFGKNPTQSCGCLHADLLAKRNRESGSQNGDTAIYRRLYDIWRGMKRRCESKKSKSYYLYGGRGISVCEEWHDWVNFKQWALNNGYREDLSIDRIDVNGNYEPNNCRWATNIEQANNTRSNKMLPYKGRTQSLADWCRELDLDYFRTKARLNSCGYTIEQAFEMEKYAAQKQFNNKAQGKKIS